MTDMCCSGERTVFDFEKSLAIVYAWSALLRTCYIASAQHPLAKFFSCAEAQAEWYSQYPSVPCETSPIFIQNLCSYR